MAIVWTKDWSGADDGTVLGGIDLKNIQDDLSNVTDVSAIGITVQAFDDDLENLSSPENINSANLVINGAFDNFPASPTPSNWTVEGGGIEVEDIINVRVGASAYEITSDADGSASRQTIYSTIDGTENSYWRGRIVTLTAQVFATAASNARIQIDDGISTSESEFHTGTTGFEELKVTHTISSTATKLDVVLLVDGNVLAATFDAVRLNNGGSSWEYVRHPAESTSGLSNTFTSIHLTESSAPTTVASEGALYTKDVNGQPELFFRNESDGSEVQLTNAGSPFGGIPTNIQVFTSDGTWTKPSGITTVLVEVQGAGGGSAGGANSAPSPGGGGGGYSKGLIAVTGDVTVTVGSGGAGGNGANDPGDAGGLSRFAGSTDITGTGGSGALAGGSSGGNGGTGSGGSLHIQGGKGDFATLSTSMNGDTEGNGGDSQLGHGGRGKFQSSLEGQLYGGGGGGKSGDGPLTQETFDGLDGADGVVIVTY